jgi:phenylpropionate dioxygenase-like ring-hydroxylating dioxygenase large terminal subunit
MVSAPAALRPPRDCTFTPSDWHALTRFWFPVAYADEVPADKPIARTLLDEQLVLFRSGEQITAAKDLCIHRGAPLSLGWVEQGEIVCAYHGFRYAADGQCVRVPAQPDAAIPKKLCLRRFATEVRHGLVWVCLSGEPLRPIPDWPELRDTALHHFRLPPQDWRASAPRQAENFNDVSHISWVHTGTFGNRERPEVERYEVHEDEHGISFDAPYHFNAGGMAGNANGATPIVYHYRMSFPFFTFLTVNFPDGKRYLLWDLPSPVSARKSRVFMLVSQNYGQASDAESVLRFQEAVLNEDRPLVESQRPEELPLDLAEEFHIRADRFSTHFRNALRRFGLGADYAA